MVLLTRCAFDSDDEVRDRACFFKDLLTNQPLATMSKLVLNALPFSAVNLERALVDYAAGAMSLPFDLSAVPLEKIAPRAVLLISDVADVKATLLSEVGRMHMVACTYSINSR